VEEMDITDIQRRIDFYMRMKEWYLGVALLPMANIPLVGEYQKSK